EERASERRMMVMTIESLAATARVGEVRRIDSDVLGAMREVPRHLLVPEDVRDYAYQNRPLPIGHEQTISQPYIVALMTHLLRPDEDDVVLEVGTGSGYQAAVLSRLVDRVYSIEIVEPLARQAKERLRALGYDNITVRQGDGYHGWPEHAPFDAILVTAAASHIPPPLVGQLKPGGRMVIPVGPPFMAQNLMLVEKDPDGKVHTRVLLPVSFVPLTGSGGR
ncbi:MAG: protein-L-isoaspartate(D-aspartate) O-methyltransferase, partial [Pseudomonadota bacterium]|nr:protein-L-isoaspartate(D-aspartate) O-methyltransferase [Pseudomonadota bacterium]